MDLYTLHVENAVFLGFYAVLTFANSRLHSGSRGVRWFPVYNLCAFAGAVLEVLHGSIPDVVSTVGGDVFVSLGYVFLYRSLAGFFGQRTIRWVLHAGFVALVFLGAWHYGVQQPDERAHLMVYSLVLTIQLSLAASLAFNRARGGVRVSSSLMGVVLMMLALSDFSRFIGMLGTSTAQYMRDRVLLEWTLLDNCVLQGAVTVAFVWMTAAALRHDLYLEASTDSLTGLLNRRAIKNAADREIQEGRQYPEQMTAILVDLDKFKELNDELGHQGGDTAIVAVARRLEHGIRKGDLLSRLGGDEFVVLLPKTPLETAVGVAERLRAMLEDAPVVYNGIEMVVRGSFGVAQVQGSSQGWKELITACDKALYQAKDRGGNCVASGGETDMDRVLPDGPPARGAVTS
jgi:diguanylate cyclase (GGDEF)-like protein